MRRFYLHTRHNGVFYAEIVNPETGLKLTARSTGSKNRDEALLVVADWLKHGIPSGRKRKQRPVKTVTGLDSILKSIRKSADHLGIEDGLQIASLLKELDLIDFNVVKKAKNEPELMEFLYNFWDYTNSPYVREKLAHGHSLGKRHCYDSTNRLRHYWEPVFRGKKLNRITKAELNGFSLNLVDENLAPNTINKILIAGITALSWACNERMIAVDPSEGLLRFSGMSKKRGVLTPQEAEKVFLAEWKDKRVYVGNLLAVTTGLRSGEVLALRKSDISSAGNVLYIRHSWSFIDGLKSTKTGEKRKVPLLPGVKEKLLELLEENPHEGEYPYVFYGLLEDKPMDGKLLLKGFKQACNSVGIDTAARGIVFHSHRHYYAARMVDRMSADEVSRITG
ncbi:MAG: tyrosine-type recombinase/integrase [Lachnoclostridium sp.]|jgi:integrase|nr:tyrosine-type recombinase/integrase [Lachnoclostridium sp.]